MEEEFDEHLQTIARLTLQITELKESVLLKEKEFTRERGMNKELQAILRRLRSDLHNAAALVQEPDNLKKAVVVSFMKLPYIFCFYSFKLESQYLSVISHIIPVSFVFSYSI